MRVLSVTQASKSEGIDSYTSKQEQGYCQFHQQARVRVLSVSQTSKGEGIVSFTNKQEGTVSLSSKQE